MSNAPAQHNVTPANLARLSLLRKFNLSTLSTTGDSAISLDHAMQLFFFPTRKKKTYIVALFFQ